MTEQAWRNRIVGYGSLDPRELTANPKNWRTHPDAQRGALEGVLGEVGWVAEVLVNRRTGFVVDGHLRVASAVSRGEPSVPVRYVDLDDAEERLVLATLDPIGALASSDNDQLAALIEGLQPADEAVAKLLRDLAPPRPKALNPDDADLTPPTEPIAQTGDLWLLGEHRLLCGDATKAEDMQRLLDRETPDYLNIDPPYGINIITPKEGFGSVGGSKPFGATSGVNRRSSTGFDSAAARRGTGLDGPTSRNQIIQSNVYPVMHGDDHPFDPSPWLQGDAVVILWGANYYADQLPISACWFCWDKREGITRNNFADCELAWCSKPGPARVFHHLWNGLHKGSQHGERRSHPTEKPVALYEEIGKMYCPDGLWLDPYAGSGAQVIAAEQIGCRCYAMEIEPAYCDVIVRRWERVSGRQAVQTHA